jgi:hypothetical protein
MKRTYRMYGLVPYNISPIQQGIQYGHAVVEYANSYFHNTEYEIWANRDKTFIILNGGTTNNKLDEAGIPAGTLNQHEKMLEYHGVRIASFSEPDLGDQLTAVVFIVDDRVFDKENWPDYRMPALEALAYEEMLTKGADSSALESFESYRIWFNKFSDNYREAERIVWLRSFLKNFRLA